MNLFSRIVKFCLIGLGSLMVAGLVIALGIFVYLSPKLPDIETLKDVHLQVPLRVYTSDQKLIAEFGEMKRAPLRFFEIPDLMIKAVLAAEDDRFFKHPGVDYQGILRAGLNLVKTGEKSQGGSTITMQVARNFFLSSEKTYLRKLSEILLALKIEQELNKEEILELYLNKIYLGNRAYGVAAASQIYYGVHPGELSVAQMAMIAGLPKAPSRYNPIADLERAVTRRNYVLGRMYKLGFINDEVYSSSLAEPDNAVLHSLTIEIEAPYVAEMVRSSLVERFGEEAYTGGYKVITTLDSHLQEAANRALRDALLDYDARHGYRGPIRHLDISIFPDEEQRRSELDNIPNVGGLIPAIIIHVEDQTAIAILANNKTVQIPWTGLSWARPYIDDNRLGNAPATAAEILSVGDIVYLQQVSKNEWRLTQIPQVEGALVAVKPDNGGIIALSGGFDFYRSKFNRVTQASRQPGSNFKPFIYSAALAKGFTPASIFNDAPVVFDDPGLESAWRPENYSGTFFGPTRLREALVHSRNLVSIRLLRSTGINYTIDYVSRFGFKASDLPKNLSLSLGSAAMTPLQIAGGYAVFANGGYRVTPYYIDRIEGENGEIIQQAIPDTVCPDCTATPPAANVQSPDIQDTTAGTGSNQAQADQDTLPQQPSIKIAQRVITPQNAYLMTSMMRDVIRRGTGRRARQLGRNDLAGKTGTTNEQRDAWFSGFNPDIVTVTWVGFDQSRSLGNNETGGRAALPMWINFMSEALKGKPEKPLERPPGLVTVRIDPESGLLVDSNYPHAIFETFRTEDVPDRHAEAAATNGKNGANGQTEVPEQLF